MKQELVIRKPCYESIVEGTRISVVLDNPIESFKLSFDVFGSAVAEDATPFLAMALPLAMMQNWTLRSELPISSRFMGSIPAIQDLYQLWEPKAFRVDVLASTEHQMPNEKGRGIGSFFSGGVDSYYTLLKNRARISSLIFIRGFDIPQRRASFAERVTGEIRKIAKETAVSLIEVTTNLRDFSNKWMNWELYHGAALASVALLLKTQLSTVYIPSTHSYSDLFPWGSHPLLDPLWSTEAVQFVHDGCEATRFQKIAAISRSDLVLKTLRVCFRNRDDQYNCGQCEKCLRTMVSLHILGRLNDCCTFRKPLDLGQLGKMRYGDNANVLSFLHENLAALKERRDDPKLQRALQQATKLPGVVQQVQRRCRKFFRRSTVTRLFR